MIANRIYQLLHPTVSPGTAFPTTTTEPSTLTINVPFHTVVYIFSTVQPSSTPAKCLMLFIAILLLIFLAALHMALDMFSMRWSLSIDITHIA